MQTFPHLLSFFCCFFLYLLGVCMRHFDIFLVDDVSDAYQKRLLYNGSDWPCQDFVKYLVALNNITRFAIAD